MKVKKCLYCDGAHLTYVTHRMDDVNIVRCEHCGLMMVEDMPSDTEKVYTADYFEKTQSTDMGYSGYFSAPAANLIGKYAFMRLFVTEGNHLDLGCADGSLMELAQASGLSSIGLDISKDAVNVAKNKGLNVTASNLHSFPKLDAPSDVVTAFDLLEHADQLGVVLRETYKQLRDGGLFIFSTLSVKKTDPSDFWFNNSLEHFSYFDKDNLAFVLEDIFGKDNFGFIEMEGTEGAEFWGFAKKGKRTDEAAVLRHIASHSYDKENPEQSYLLSLFYNQVSLFETSAEIIEHFASTWSPSRYAEASFYHSYAQGKIEQAVMDAKEHGAIISANNSVYWQALADAENTLWSMKRQDLLDESSDEILQLREQLFRTRDELHTLKNSRVVGRIIKARDRVGDQVPKIRHAPRTLYHFAKPRIAKVTPGPVRRTIMRAIRHDYNLRSVKTKFIQNKPWKHNAPLLTVVIPYYNRADTIDDTINSLLTQTFTHFEVIIVDDGSPEQASVAKLAMLGDVELDIRVVTQKNQGVATARNNGIKLAKGRYIICLDSDDMLEPTFIEKAVTIMETNPEISLMTSYMKVFGVKNEPFQHVPYDPLDLYRNNMVITAAAFRKEAWEATNGGYKSDIGYEDWEYWISLAEHGYWGKVVPEELFNYRTSMQSRYVDDKDKHWKTIKNIKELHPNYKTRVKKLLQKRQLTKLKTVQESAFINLDSPTYYRQPANDNKHILVVMPWMTFGGAETLINNFSIEIASKYNLSFITGLQSKNEWEYKFKQITPNVYHLPNLFSDEELYVAFILNYIETRQVDVLHIVHTNYVFGMLEEIKRRFPNLRIIITMFNDRVPEYFGPSVALENLIDAYSTDNSATARHYQQDLTLPVPVVTIPNGIDCYDIYNPALFDRERQRQELKLASDDTAVFFVGRLSEEKNPDVFLQVAENILKKHHAKHVKFFVIGDGNMRPLIEKMIASIGSDAVTYLGYQSEVSKFLSAADIFVLPSSIEGFPLSILEAMAMNLAVVASNVGAVGDVLANGEDGFVVKPGSAEEITDIVLALHKDAKLLADVKVKARAKLESNFSNIALRRNYLALYKEVLK